VTTIDPDRWARIDELFGAALDLPEADRQQFLAELCGEDQELFEAVQSLLDRVVVAEALIGESVDGFAPDILASLPPPGGEADDEEAGVAGRVVGPYRLVGELGRGGMGAVYLAERADGEFEKRVALKLVKRGMDTDEILRRFQSERRILASLEHPHIARLYDGGAAADGRPYLVMELVDGERITDYCDQRRLGISDRLAIFRSVCDAVQHAHQNLVVHRDIKPSNILVTADGTPKLLDFGIARLVEEDGDDGLRTRTGMRILTPEYAAPEQLRGERVTTATDVYALGAVLYELLAGWRPLERRGAPRNAMDGAPAPGGPWGDSREGGRSLTDEGVDPAITRPSAAVHGSLAATVAAARGTTPDRLGRALRGDLDTVVMKALSGDPRDRYPSAQQLLEDLDRYREGLPVLARPPALFYRLAKFTRRHRVSVLAASLVLLSLLGGLGAALWQAGEAKGARERADRARAIAEEERDAAEAVAGFLEGMFAAADPFSVRPGRMDTLRVGAFLERGADRIGEEFGDRPLIRARMQGALGRAYRSLGVYDRAEALLTESLETYQAEHGDVHTDVADALNALGNLFLALERPADAERLHRQALAIRRELLDPHHPHIGASLNNLAAALQDAGRLDEAEPLYDEILALHRRLDPPDSAAYADALNTRMALAYRKDDLEVALPLAREILAINRALFGDRHPRVTQGMNNLGQLLSRTGADAEAEPLLRQALDLNRELLGGEHPNIAAGAGNLAGVLLRLDRPDDAEPLYLEAIAMNRKLLGDRHPALAVSLSNYADLLVRRQAYAEAETLYQEALTVNRSAFGDAHPSVGIVTTGLAAALCRQGQVEEGRRLFDQALAILRATLAPDHSRITAAESAAAGCGD
jgi:eukaryotic-like serine/threonine-protein kinase